MTKIDKFMKDYLKNNPGEKKNNIQEALGNRASEKKLYYQGGIIIIKLERKLSYE